MSINSNSVVRARLITNLKNFHGLTNDNSLVGSAVRILDYQDFIVLDNCVGMRRDLPDITALDVLVTTTIARLEDTKTISRANTERMLSPLGTVRMKDYYSTSTKKQEEAAQEAKTPGFNEQILECAKRIINSTQKMVGCLEYCLM
jgi:hypothetical protein